MQAPLIELRGRRSVAQALGISVLMILFVILLWQIGRGVSGFTKESDKQQMTASLTQIRAGLISVCRNEKNPYTLPGGGQPTLTLDDINSVYVLSCEAVEILDKIPQRVRNVVLFRYDTKQIAASKYDGWDEVLLDCAKFSADQKSRRIHVLNFFYKWWDYGPIPLYKVTDLAADCSLHDFISYSASGVGEFYGGTTQVLEIGISEESGEVYVSGGGGA